MKKNIIRTIKMAAFYTFMGLIFQGILVNILLASSPAEGQNLRDIKVSVNVVNVTLEQAFQLIGQRTNFVFSYLKEEIPLNEKATVIVDDESLYNILEVFARDYGLTFNRINNYITVKKSKGQTEDLVTAIETGIVKGKITDAVTKEALYGASVVLKGTTLGGYTDSKGNFEIDNIKPGKYTISASYVGYSTTTKIVEVSADKSTEVNLALGQSVINLDEVTVTGSISDRSIRESSNPISIIAPRELENRNLSDLTSVLGTIPGVVPAGVTDQISSRGRTNGNLALINIRGFSPTDGNLSGPTKYILDGVEVFNSGTLNNLDPNQIAKIEVSRGPMSSTLYGAGSSGGIIQIFTKKGSGDLSVNFRTMFTSKESKYQDSNPLNSEYSLSLRGGKADFGYNIGIDYTKIPISRWTKNSGIDENDWIVSAGIHGNISNVKADVNVQYSTSYYGSALQQTWYLIALEQGWKNASSLLKTSFTDTRTQVDGINLTLNLRQPLTQNLYHNLTAGISNSLSKSDDYTVIGTNYYALNLWNLTRRSLKYFLNLDQPLSDDFKVNLTGGFEYSTAVAGWNNNGYTTPYQENIDQSLNGPNGGIARTETSGTTGLFAEGIWGFQENLFLTTGLRMEKNTSYGADVGWLSMPRVGLTYIAKLGDFTFKPRVSYGKSTMSLPPAYRIGKLTVIGTFSMLIMPNPDIQPQSQSGYEIGTDIFFGQNFFVGITYYDQLITNMVQTIVIPDPAYMYKAQNVNIAKAFNKGLELSGKALLGPLALDVSFTSISSRYGSGFNAGSVILINGERTIQVPSGSFFAKLTYSLPSFLPWSEKGGNISVEYRSTGSERTANLMYYNQTLAETGKTPANKYEEFPGYSMFNLRADYSVLNNMSLFVDVKNLLNNQDVVAGYYGPLQGRVTSFGLNLKL